MKKQEYILRQETSDDSEIKYTIAHLDKMEICAALLTVRRRRDELKDGLDTISMELGICPENSTMEIMISKIRELSKRRES